MRTGTPRYAERVDRFQLKPYEPPRWLRQGHVNTIYSYLKPRPLLPLSSEDVLLNVESGVDLLLCCHWQPLPAPVLILVHGLEGHSEAGYMLTTAAKAFRRGFHVIRTNVRSCGRSEAHCRTLYNSGLSRDLARVVEWVGARPGVTEIHLCGFSMGGNIVLKYAGETGDNFHQLGVRSATVISACLDLAPSADALHRRANLLYERRFLRGLRARIRRKAEQAPGLIPPRMLAELNSISSIREWDDRITAPLTEYRDAVDYYHRASAARFVSRIRIPTLVLHAEDDPFIVITAESRQLLRANAAIDFHPTPHGGHCGFMGSTVPGDDTYWAENRVLDYCQYWVQHRFAGSSSSPEAAVVDATASSKH